MQPWAAGRDGGTTLASFDGRQRRLAARAGLKVMPAEPSSNSVFERYSSKGPVDGLFHIVILRSMNTTTQADTVWFTTKGQVVIPLRLRKLFQIEDGTRAILTATEEGILRKPVTAALIKRGRGIIKRKPGDKPLSEWWAEQKAEEYALEEAKDARSTGGSR